jgi:flagellar protein FliS
MLYDEAVRQLDKAIDLLDEYVKNDGKKDPSKIEPISKAIVKTQNIITELITSLDMEQGEISENLFSLYTWFNKELFEANISHDKRRVTVVRNLLSELRSTWSEVVAKVSTEEKGRVPVSNVNISY